MVAGTTAGGTVGRCRDDASARGIPLVDRHGVDAQPIVGEQRIDAVAAPLFLQLS